MGLAVTSFFMLAPLLWMICAAFKTSGDMWTYTLLPYETQERLEIIEGKNKGAKLQITGLTSATLLELAEAAR